VVTKISKEHGKIVQRVEVLGSLAQEKSNSGEALEIRKNKSGLGINSRISHSLSLICKRLTHYLQT